VLWWFVSLRDKLGVPQLLGDLLDTIPAVLLHPLRAVLGGEGVGGVPGKGAEGDGRRLRGLHGQARVRLAFRFGLLGAVRGDEVVVERVLDVWGPVFAAVESLKVGLILGEEELGDDAGTIDENDAALGRRSGCRTGRAVKAGGTEGVVPGVDDTVLLLVHVRALVRHFLGPGPGVAEEELREDVQIGGVGTSVVRGNPDRHGVCIVLIFGVLAISAILA
jgi:hypothetical protein